VRRRDPGHAIGRAAFERDAEEFAGVESIDIEIAIAAEGYAVQAAALAQLDFRFGQPDFECLAGLIQLSAWPPGRMRSTPPSATLPT
jgi:hypothetical protein